MKADILQVVFDSRSWSKIKEFPPERLGKGLKAVKFLCAALKTAGEVPEDTVSWLRGQLIQMDDNVPAAAA